MQIDITQPDYLFERHFFNSKNKRILFSGPFGSGKTYFLQEFFKKNKDKANVFWLSPLKYSVSQNEDIFEYIKFDIALQLIKMPEFLIARENKFGEDQYLYQYLSSQPLLTVDTLFSLITIFTDSNDSVFNEDYQRLLSAVQPLIKELLDKHTKYKDFKEKIDSDSQSDSKYLITYMTNSSLKKGSIFEDDLITQTIRTALSICKISSKKDNILLIDDFDRLDPEHVFRILNIFSVHNDHYDEENKFGFDKIIIVCDYSNIARIYAHKYGNTTNFSGYINKFFSTDVFSFNNVDTIQNYCRYKLNDILHDRDSQDVLGLILSYLTKNNIITLRDIVKMNIPQVIPDFSWGYNIWKDPSNFKGYSIKEYEGNYAFIKEGVQNFNIFSSSYPFLNALKILSIIMGSYDNLFLVMEKLSKEAKDKLDLEDLPKIIRSLMSLFHHAKNYKDPALLAFSFRGDQYQHRLTISYPKCTFLGKEFMLPIGWTVSKQYDEQFNYYQNIQNGLSQVKFNEETFDIQNLLYSSLFDIIRRILLFLGDTGRLYNLGITNNNSSLIN